MTLYLSGPMRGYPNFNFDTFHRVTAALRRDGHFVFSPAEHDEHVYPNIRTWAGFATGDVEQCPQFNLPTSIAWDFARILDSDAIALLPGWERSAGAKAERFVAEACGKRIWLVLETALVSALVADDTPRLAYPQLKETPHAV